MYLPTLLSISLTPHSSLHLSVQPCSFSVFFCIFMYLSVSVFLRVLSFSDLVSALVSFCLSLIPCVFLSLTLSVYLYNSVSIIHPLCIYISTHVCFVFISSSSHPYSHSWFLYPNILLWICQILSIFLLFSLSCSHFFLFSHPHLSLSRSPSLSSFNMFFSSRYFRHSLNPCPRSRNASIPCVKGTCFAKAVKRLPMAQLKVNPVATWWKTKY